MTNNTFNKSDARVGFIGLGLMGSRFLRRLNAEGWKVRGWNRSQTATLHLMNKDLGIVQNAATCSVASLPAASATISTFGQAVGDRGELDISAITPYVRGLAPIREEEACRG